MMENTPNFGHDYDHIPQSEPSKVVIICD